MKKLFREINQEDINVDKEYKVNNNILSNQVNVLNIDQTIKNENDTYEDYIENHYRDYIDQSELEMLIEQMNLFGILVI